MLLMSTGQCFAAAQMISLPFPMQISELPLTSSLEVDLSRCPTTPAVLQ